MITLLHAKSGLSWLEKSRAATGAATGAATNTTLLHGLAQAGKTERRGNYNDYDDSLCEWFASPASLNNPMLSSQQTSRILCPYSTIKRHQANFHQERA
jgi:hypothetical protein